MNSQKNNIIGCWEENWDFSSEIIATKKQLILDANGTFVEKLFLNDGTLSSVYYGNWKLKKNSLILIFSKSFQLSVDEKLYYCNPYFSSTEKFITHITINKNLCLKLKNKKVKLKRFLHPVAACDSTVNFIYEVKNIKRVKTK